MVVTKFFPASDVRYLAELGVTDVGENRHPEAHEKQAMTADLPLTWHFIGALQSNKAAAIASYADVVESVDRGKVISGLARGLSQRRRQHRLSCLLQVSLDDPAGGHRRSGADPGDLISLAQIVNGTEGLELGGLMAVAPLGVDAQAAFARLAEIRKAFVHEHPRATVLSAGMSGDLEEAIQHGATHVRVGRSVLGPRS